MFIIYILQNAGFLSFPDQASCLEARGSEGQQLTALRSRTHLRSMVAGRPRGPELYGIFPSGSQGSRQHVHSTLPHFCLLRTFSPMEALMATLIALCQSQSGAHRREAGRRIELGRKGESLEKVQFLIFLFILFFQDLFCFHGGIIEVLVLLCLRLYKLFLHAIENEIES